MKKQTKKEINVFPLILKDESTGLNIEGKNAYHIELKKLIK